MSDQSQNTPEYLQSLLHAKPGSPEELADSKAKIAKYFAEQRKMEEAWTEHSAQAGQAGQAAHSAEQTSSAAVQTAVNSPLDGKSAAIRITLSTIAILTLAAALGKAGLLVLLLAFPLIIWAIQLYLQPGKKMTQLKPLSIKPASAKTHTQSRIRRAGEGGEEKHREKWQKLQTQMHLILNAKKLDGAYGPAEEALSLTAYLVDKNNKHKRESTHIDPVNMLIERLIEEGEFEWADKLSQHYLALLTASE